MRSILAVKSHSQPRQIPVSSRGPSSPSPASLRVAIIRPMSLSRVQAPRRLWATRSAVLLGRRRRLAILGHIHQADRLSPSSCRLWLSCLRRRGALSFRSDRVEAPGRAASGRMTYRPHQGTPVGSIGSPVTIFTYTSYYYTAASSGNPAGGTVTANPQSALGDFVTLIGGQNSSPTIIMGGWGGALGNVSMLYGLRTAA